MAFTKLIASLLIIISSTSVIAAPATSLIKSRTEILQIGARLNALEKNLGQHNDKYLAAIERIRLIEADVVNYQQKLSHVKEAAQKRELELATILRAHALSMVEDEVVPNDSYRQMIESNRQEAQSLSREAEALEKIVGEFQERLNVLRQDEQDMLKLASDLESKKKQMTEIYLTKLEERQKLEGQVQKQKISARVSAFKRAEKEGLDIPVALKFAPPLTMIDSAVASEKGVTYKFGQLQPIKAPRAGRVVYNGELASYGKVLMIDHGNDIRTVMLGRFTSELAKNAQVEVGDTLGHTETGADSLYFEVRKKNVAQKTIHWIEQGATSKI